MPHAPKTVRKISLISTQLLPQISQRGQQVAPLWDRNLPQKGYLHLTYKTERTKKTVDRIDNINIFNFWI